MRDQHFHDDLARLWDAAFRGDVPDAHLEDDHLARIIRRIHEIDHVPAPGQKWLNHAKERVMSSNAMTLPASKELTPFAPQHHNGTRPSAVPDGRGRPRNAYFAVAIAVLVVVASALGYGASLLVSDNDPSPAVIPAYQEDSTLNAATGFWPTYRGNAQKSGVVPGPGIAGTPKITWEYVAGDYLYYSPVVSDGVIYLPTTGKKGIIALDAATHRDLWSFSGAGGPLAMYEGVLIARSGSDWSTVAADLLGIDMQTGAELWRNPGTQSYLVAPVVDKGILYLPAIPDKMEALDPTTGDVLWSTSVPSIIDKGVALSPNLILLMLIDGTAVALDRDDGSQVWTSSLPQTVYTAPAVNDEIVLMTSLVDQSWDVKDQSWGFGEDHSSVYALDLETGRLLWQVDSATGTSFQDPAVARNAAYIPSTDGTLTAVDLKTGQMLWQNADAESLHSPPVLVDETIYQSGFDGYLYAIDAESGVTNWTFEFGLGSSTEAVVTNSVVYVMREEGVMFEIQGAASAGDTSTADTSAALTQR